jgi:hypothetical protein
MQRRMGESSTGDFKELKVGSQSLSLTPDWSFSILTRASAKVFDGAVYIQMSCRYLFTAHFITFYRAVEACNIIFWKKALLFANNVFFLRTH